MSPQDHARNGEVTAPAKPDSGSGSFDGDMEAIAKGFIEGRPEYVAQVVSWARSIAEHRAWGFDSADDIVQATLLAVVQNMRNGRFKGGDLRAYVRRIAKNMCISSYRRTRSRGAHVSLGAVTDSSSFRDCGGGVERRIMLEQMLDRLEQGCRELILRAYIKGFSRKEIGAWLGISEQAARVRLYRCVENARQLLTARTAAPGDE